MAEKWEQNARIHEVEQKVSVWETLLERAEDLQMGLVGIRGRKAPNSKGQMGN
jgi:hypothetical protein